MKIFFKIIAWIGFGIFSLGVIVGLTTTSGYWVNPPTQYGGGVDFGHPFAIILALIGIPFMLIGGLPGRPKCFWLGCIIMGSLYILVFLPFIEDIVSKIQHTEQEWLFKNGWIFRNALQELGPIILGLIGVVEGVLLKRIENRVNSEQVESPSKN